MREEREEIPGWIGVEVEGAEDAAGGGGGRQLGQGTGWTKTARLRLPIKGHQINHHHGTSRYQFQHPQATTKQWIPLKTSEQVLKCTEAPQVVPGAQTTRRATREPSASGSRAASSSISRGRRRSRGIRLNRLVARFDDDD